MRLWSLLRRGIPLFTTGSFVLCFHVLLRTMSRTQSGINVVDEAKELDVGPIHGNVRYLSWTNFFCDRCNNFTYHQYLKAEDLCNHGDVFLLFLVMSRTTDRARRDIIRETWGTMRTYRGVNIRTVFVIGVHEDMDNSELQSEFIQHGDMIQGNFTDSYRTLTEKVMFGLKWVLQTCPSAKYVVKTDDDMFNSPATYVDYLTMENNERFIGGRCIAILPDRNPKKKSYVSMENYGHLYSPYYCQGGGYIVSKQAVIDIVQVSDNTSYNPMEDQFVVGMCRVAAGIPFTQIPGMMSQKVTPCYLSNSAFNVHGVNKTVMNSYWDIVRNKTGCHQMYRNAHPNYSRIQCGVVMVTFFLLILWVLFLRSLISIEDTRLLSVYVNQMRHKLNSFHFPLMSSKITGQNSNC